MVCSIGVERANSMIEMGRPCRRPIFLPALYLMQRAARSTLYVELKVKQPTRLESRMRSLKFRQAAHGGFCAIMFTSSFPYAVYREAPDSRAADRICLLK